MVNKVYIRLIILCFVLSYSCSTTGDHNYAPILVLATKANFGTYTGEILKAEGFNEFILDSLTDNKITPDYLTRFDIVILSETAVTKEQNALLTDYVNNGGTLIAFRPDKQLGELFGIIQTNSSVKEGYIKIDTTNNTGRGLVGESVQFHGYSDIYKLNGGEEIASLFLNSDYSTGFPAVVANDYGRGHTAAFTYNLPKSIVLTRQGNPEWAGQERDRVDGPTATDLFYPLKGEVQWNNPEKIDIPQADEQMRLLSHLIERFAGYKKPLPRLWYFPERYRCIFIFTIDGEDSQEADIDSEIKDVQGKGGNATLYEIGTYISASTVNQWRSDGHEVAIHYNDVPNYDNPTYSTMVTVFDTMTANFRKAYGISPKTLRNHWVVWCSKDSVERKHFAEQAAIEEKYGLGLDCNYYQFGGNKVYPNWIGDVGHFTGSGIPMKFADATGRILDIYQSNTQLPDETWLKENIEGKSKVLIDRSLDEENYTYINANYHTWYWPECREPGLRVLDYCNSRGVPIWTAERVYEFLKMKDEASFSDIEWSANILTFNLKSGIPNPDGLTILIPSDHGDLRISRVAINGHIGQFERRSVKGYEYALIKVNSGKNYTISVNYL